MKILTGKEANVQEAKGEKECSFQLQDANEPLICHCTLLFLVSGHKTLKATLEKLYRLQTLDSDFRVYFNKENQQKLLLLSGSLRIL